MLIDNYTNNCNYYVSKVFLWVNSNLDGAGSTILLGNIFKNLEYRGVFFGKFEQEYFEWFDENFQNYDKIFIVGMPLNQELINKIEHKKVIFVSNQPNSLNVQDSTLIQEECTSYSKLIYKKFSKSLEFPKEIKQLIAIVDDYMSYKLKLSETMIVNAIFRKSGSKAFYNFVNNFWNGYREFNDGELKLAENFYNELNSEIESLDLYKGVYKKHSVIATFSKFSANEIAHAILNTYNPDIVVVINLDTKFVSFRKNKNSTADILYMSQNLCNGGGVQSASGGQLTSKFLEFTNQFKPL